MSYSLVGRVSEDITDGKPCGEDYWTWFSIMCTLNRLLVVVHLCNYMWNVNEIISRSALLRKNAFSLAPLPIWSFFASFMPFISTSIPPGGWVTTLPASHFSCLCVHAGTGRQNPKSQRVVDSVYRALLPDRDDLIGCLTALLLSPPAIDHHRNLTVYTLNYINKKQSQ